MEKDINKIPKVLHIAPEMAPFSKVGGLADVVSSLPQALARFRTDARVLIPAYPGVLDKAHDMGLKITRIRRDIHVALNWRVKKAKLWKIQYGDIPVYAIDNSEIFNDPLIYPEELDPETILPFCFLSLAGYELSQAIPWKPDILHAHDWGTSLVPISGKWHPFYSMAGKEYRTVYTIHNLAHQGIISPSILEGLGMKDSLTIDRLEFFGSVNLMKGALITSDAVTTVSPRYAQEITGETMGMGLEGVIREQKNKIRGILNGLDTRYWDPSNDKLIPFNYSITDIAGKRSCKKDLMERTGLVDISRPLVTMVGRLYSQKGIELVIENMDDFIKEGANIFILGSGDETFERALETKASSLPDRVAFARGYNEPLAHLAYAAGDIFLMPSRFEPCGLSQLIALRYGNIPLVRKTGGLADTILDADRNTRGYGFVFSDFSSSSMLLTCKRALQAFYSGERWNNIVARAMGMDFSWDRSAPEYQSLYSRTILERTRGD